MRIPLFISFILCTIGVATIVSCKKESIVIDDTDYQPERLTELVMPLQAGKYITYRVDSTVFPNFGRSIETHKYLVKHVVDSLLTDNLGRPGYRVFTYISDSAGSLPWQPNGSYFITVLTDQVEMIENNQRIIRIHVPVRDGSEWKGNTYLADDPFGGQYNFSNDDNMADWEFHFEGGFQPSISLEGNTYNDVYTVIENDDVDPILDPSDYGSESISKAIYAKNTGLVYREFTLWEQQPNPAGNPPDVTFDPFRVGFGMKMWMVDHN